MIDYFYKKPRNCSKPIWSNTENNGLLFSSGPWREKNKKAYIFKFYCPKCFFKPTLCCLLSSFWKKKNACCFTWKPESICQLKDWGEFITDAPCCADSALPCGEWWDQSLAELQNRTYISYNIFHMSWPPNLQLCFYLFFPQLATEGEEGTDVDGWRSRPCQSRERIQTQRSRP